MDTIKGLMEFIDRVPTAFHAVENITVLLDEAGFERLEEQKSWSLFPIT